jgi:proteic killer suppression protein
VIVSFASGETERLFLRVRVRRFQAFERQAQRKLALLHAAANLNDLRAIPGNRLEKLRADREGQYSIRINDQWRVCFVWKDGNAHKVEIVDYH